MKPDDIKEAIAIIDFLLEKLEQSQVSVEIRTSEKLKNEGEKNGA